MAKTENEPTELPEIFIKPMMKSRGLKNKEIAEIIGTTDATISRKLNGARGLDLPWLLAFAKALKVDVWDLFRPESSREPETPETALRSAMIAYGVDHSQLDRAMTIVGTFLSSTEAEEKPTQTRLDGQSQPANLRRESTPSK